MPMFERRHTDRTEPQEGQREDRRADDGAAAHHEGACYHGHIGVFFKANGLLR